MASSRARLRAPCLAVLLTAGAAAWAQGTWEVQAYRDQHSDFSSISDLRADDRTGYSARSSQNLAYVDEEVRLQRRGDGPWTWALLARSSATLTANRDAIEASRHVRGLGRDGNVQQWNVDARLRGFAGFGAELARRFEFGPEWRGLALVQALALTRWRDRKVDGTAGFEAATSTYSFDLRSSEVNDRLDFPFRTDVAPRGAALLFGGDIGWSNGAYSLSAGVRDLGWLHWRDVPQQDFTLSSDTRSVDEDGFVIYKPLLQGQNRQGALTRTAPLRGFVAGSWQATAAGTLWLRARHFDGFGWRPSIAWAQRWGAWQAEGRYDIGERRIVFDAAWGRWRLRAGFDRLDGGAHSRLFGVSYTAPWW